MQSIKYYHKNSDKVAYKKFIRDDDYWDESTYDDNGNELTYKNSDGFSFERTFDENNNELTYKNSDDLWWKRTYDDGGNELTHQVSNGYFKIKGKEVTEEEFEAFVRDN